MLFNFSHCCCYTNVIHVINCSSVFDTNVIMLLIGNGGYVGCVMPINLCDRLVELSRRRDHQTLSTLHEQVPILVVQDQCGLLEKALVLQYRTFPSDTGQRPIR